MNNQKYIIVKADKVVREASASVCQYYEHAVFHLKPQRGERLYVEVVVRKPKRFST
jgi:hypothetical protein